MKRQRGVNVINGVNNSVNVHAKVEQVAAVPIGKKKSKKEAEQKNVVQEEEKKQLETIEMVRDHNINNNVMGVNSWEDQCVVAPWLGVVDEQMSWGSTWFPSWDMDFMGDAFSALYSDVVWDDDIWNLNNQIPIPPIPLDR